MKNQDRHIVATEPPQNGQIVVSKSSLYKYYTLQGLNKLPKTPEMRDKAMKKNICMN